jgi:hypothetical protein
MNMNTLMINKAGAWHKKASAFFLTILILSFIHTPLNAATTIFNDGFETGNLVNYDPKLKGGTFNVITSPISAGKYAGKLNLDFVSSSADNYRAETQLANNKHNFSFGKEYWFSYHFRLEDWAKDNSPEFAPFQVHLRPGSWDAKCQVGAAAGTAPLFMHIVNDVMSFKVYGNKSLWQVPVKQKTWQTITVHFKPSYGNDGLIEAWHNGTFKGKFAGANQMKYDNCGNVMKAPYLNVGIYKWDWRQGRPATQSKRRTLLFDNFKIAEGSSAYSLVTSGTTSSGTTSSGSTSSGTTSASGAPVISNIQASVGSTQATITWDTNESASSMVKYDPTKTYSLTVASKSYVTKHSLTLNNLKAGTRYYYFVKSWDTNGNASRSSALTFTTGSSSSSTSTSTSTTSTSTSGAPVISNIQASVGGTQATISWATNESADSMVKYDPTKTYSLTAASRSYTTRHSLTLKNLRTNTKYYYFVKSRDTSGNVSRSSVLAFTTRSSNFSGSQTIVVPGTFGTDGVVGHWPMTQSVNNTTPDRSGNGYNGTLVNGARITDNGTLLLDGTDDYMDIGRPNVTGNAMTISAWFWSEDLANCRKRSCRIISKALGRREQKRDFMISTGACGIGKTCLRFSLNTDGSTSTVKGSSNVENNSWVHVAAVYDGGEMRIYQDGTLVGSRAKSGELTFRNTASTWIGGNGPKATSRPWKGQIADVIMYNYALTPSQISGLAQ